MSDCAEQSLVYLDNAATTPLWPEVAQWLAQPQLFGNPSSGHAAGRKAKALLDKARSWVAQDLGVAPEWVLFTASATESDNLAILGSVRAMQRQASGPLHLLASALEHPAVLAPLQQLKAQGHELTLVTPDAQGRLDAARVLGALRPDTALLSMMAVHNELGLILPIREVSAALAEHSARFHCDGVQAVATPGALPQAEHLDLLTLTAHKIGGPKGVGVLVRNPKLTIDPLCVGGGQESGLRPGTENATMAFAFALALRTTVQRREALDAQYKTLSEQLVKGLRERIPGVISMAERGPCAPHIVTVCIPGHSGRELVSGLDAKGICVSAGSACHSHDPNAKSAAQHLGIDAELARGTLRFSLGPHNSAEHVQAALSAISGLVQ